MIYYFGFYKSELIKDFYPNGSINAISFKMDYIKGKLKESGEKITLISSYISDREGYYPYRKVVVDDAEIDHYLPCLRLKGVFSKLTGIFRYVTVFFYLMQIIKRNSTVVVYHHTSFVSIIKFITKIKKLKVILEIEEVFHVNTTLRNLEKLKKKENCIFNLADGYIIVNDLIYPRYINNNKKHIVIYGTYNNLKLDMNRNPQKRDKIRIIYSGSIDKVRGAFFSVDIAKCLDKNYELHICGSGTHEMVEELQKKIEQCNDEDKGCKIVFHGQLNDDKLEQLIESCEIGLNLQDIGNPFEAVSFPSKITFYLLHGLNVFSTEMSSVKASLLSNCVTFIKSNPIEASSVIMSTQLKPSFSNIRFMQELDAKALEDLVWLVK